jgi:lipopolysaccharide/colanic/teichoic acid biosynthesis glycosyltransferase
VDVLVASVALLALVPLLVLVVVAVLVDSRGPVIYAQPRVGRFGAMFLILKFRSMVRDADRQGSGVSGHRDPRITRVGSLLRRVKLDEIPQLLNVLRGEMTLIGPRPEVMCYLRYYSPAELQVLTVRPGITGPGQILFTNVQASELDACDDPEAHYVNCQLHPKLLADVQYLRRRSLRVDLKVMAGTVAMLFRLAGRSVNRLEEVA